MVSSNHKLAISNRIRSTPYTSRNEAAGVKAYTVYNNMLLPTLFRSANEDYWHLCTHVQVWDVSCERQIQVKGPDAARLVQWMTPRDISRAEADQCFYLPLCDQDGGIINDPIAIHLDENTWWLSIADSDVLLWAKGLAYGKGFDVEVRELDIWPLAVQGPKAERLMERVFGPEVRSIRFFRYKHLKFEGHSFIVARSGWSKQGGFEIYVDNAELGARLWDALFEQGEDLEVGPGCPSLIERIESGLLSLGNDMDSRHNIFQCGLDKFCHLDSDLTSISLPALRAIRKQGVKRRLVGLIGEGVSDQAIEPQIFLEENVVGRLTSSCLSARYDAWLAFAMIDVEAIERSKSSPVPILSVCSQGQEWPLRCTELPFDFTALNISERSKDAQSIAWVRRP